MKSQREIQNNELGLNGKFKASNELPQKESEDTREYHIGKAICNKDILYDAVDQCCQRDRRIYTECSLIHPVVKKQLLLLP